MLMYSFGPYFEVPSKRNFTYIWEDKKLKSN